MEKIKASRKRYPILDEYRGLVVLNMIAFHALWDLVYIYGWDLTWYKDTPAQVWQIWICSSFIFLSGFCWQLGRKQAKRGVEVFVAGIIITVATLLVMPSARVVFGVLTFHGSAMLIVWVLSKELKKISALLGFFISLTLFLFTFSINHGYLGFFGKELIALPGVLYANLFTTYLGFPEVGFFSTDYFSVFPWIFLYIAGYFFYSLCKKNDKMDWARVSLCKPLGGIGRSALPIYMLHQPVVYGICVVLDYMGII